MRREGVRAGLGWGGEQRNQHKDWKRLLGSLSAKKFVVL